MRIFYIVLGFLIMTETYGQKPEKFDYQFDFGTTLSIPYKRTVSQWPEIYGHPQKDYSVNLGYFLETLVFYNLSEKYKIKTGFNYEYNRLKINNQFGLTTNKGNIITSYLNWPILVEYEIVKNISVSAGLNPGLLLIAREKGISHIDTSGFILPRDQDLPIFSSIDPDQEYNNNIEKYYKKLDVGLLVQMDYKAKINDKMTGVIFTRFNYGLRNVYKYSTDPKWKNYYLLIGFGIKL